MPTFAANLSMLFTDVPFLERIAAARSAGFKAVECQFPYALDKHELASTLNENGLALALFNLPAGDWEAGERGIACHPDRVGEFRDGVWLALEYAQVLGCSRLNCLAGKLPAGVVDDEARSTLLANLKWAASKLEKVGIALLIEPVNTFDVPGFVLTNTDDAVSLIHDAGVFNLFVQYDIYHAQRMKGELANTIQRHLPLIGHMQLADNPGRHEPGTGEINFRWLLPYIDTLGYDGYIGCEYIPASTTINSLDWLKDSIQAEYDHGKQ
ncbi:hydroxypyruvate isomerase [Paraburkholderia xenovorans LB400]|uniref:Hydroxypyruvate isomerase n=1 Tax=Paraburkholderia xenovorans (strain LB400) TaxID=266265 RepID=Q13GF6_PARXL|nr:hydroxypyruvate isomerase [Paraburkholderia xenovorans]ABE36833.1 Hydroxypyruvate isomerase [Paraburkholderia xenovorans LB400]AIP33914.1 hydroxypyruvate isomerase [Paraburkholderia xenovorans LB400]